MACGLPVVATEWNELKIINGPFYLAKNLKEFEEKINIALKLKNSKDKYIEFAKKYSWSEIFKNLVKNL